MGDKDRSNLITEKEFLLFFDKAEEYQRVFDNMKKEKSAANFKMYVVNIYIVGLIVAPAFCTYEYLQSESEQYLILLVIFTCLLFVTMIGVLIVPIIRYQFADQFTHLQQQVK